MPGNGFHVVYTGLIAETCEIMVNTNNTGRRNCYCLQGMGLGESLKNNRMFCDS